jgi:hypothetical protein
MDPGSTVRGVLGLLRRPRVVLPAVAFVTTLAFLYARAPHQPNPHLTAAALATQIATNTPGPRPTPGPSSTPEPTATPDPQSAVRDDRRVQDVQRIKAALDRYGAEKGSFPATGPSIQTLCQYPNLDAGCKLKDYLAPFPVDPLLGSGSIFRYRSDGTSYTVFVELEVAGREPPCLDAGYTVVQLREAYCIEGRVP